MRLTLLQIVQKILSSMDSESVNAIADTEEAQQIAGHVEDVYWDMVSARLIPEHKELFKLTSLSDSAKPTHFQYPTSVKEIEFLDYNLSTDSTFTSYSDIRWVEPTVFLSRTDNLQQDYLLVSDPNGSTTLSIINNQMPSFYTSFDDLHIVMNSYDSGTEATLQSSKTRAYGTKYPSFNSSDDTFTPDIDDVMFPYLLREAMSMCMSLYLGAVDPKVEQAARRQKTLVQNDRYRTKKDNVRNGYGRN